MRTPDRQRPETSEDPRASLIALIGVVGAVLTFVLIILLQVLFYRVERGEIERKVYSKAPEELVRIRAEQEERLHSYRWVDEKAGVASIPIERAMKIVVEELNRERDAGETADGNVASGVSSEDG